MGFRVKRGNRTEVDRVGRIYEGVLRLLSPGDQNRGQRADKPCGMPPHTKMISWQERTDHVYIAFDSLQINHFPDH